MWQNRDVTNNFKADKLQQKIDHIDEIKRLKKINLKYCRYYAETVK